MILMWSISHLNLSGSLRREGICHKIHSSWMLNRSQRLLLQLINQEKRLRTLQLCTWWNTTIWIPQTTAQILSRPIINPTTRNHIIGHWPKIFPTDLKEELPPCQEKFWDTNKSLRSRWLGCWYRQRCWWRRNLFLLNKRCRMWSLLDNSRIIRGDYLNF